MLENFEIIYNQNEYRYAFLNFLLGYMLFKTLKTSFIEVSGRFQSFIIIVIQFVDLIKAQ